MPVSRIKLPERPVDLKEKQVAVWCEDVVIDTYAVGDPDPYPEYFNTRVYQGSSGTVYPLPYFESVARSKHPTSWKAVHLENEYLRLMILPQLGGRIHIAMDRTNNYDFVYRNNVIKPALVGLTGPWISGGIEFNWPQHHRPTTYLPTDVHIEEDCNGSATVWCSDHDPFSRMKGMHGVCLNPGSSLIELKVRVFNRSESVQTFLWWSNVAAAVNDNYQSFFPPDVHLVADHSKRAVATFPQVKGKYYGVDYGARVDASHPDADRLDWYRNIQVPTSYMCVSSRGDFLGGYDHAREAGFIYWADHRIAPGKKQWTWGNAPFGWAWDRNLTDTDGPYVELMAGAYTDNQPDFSFLLPGETKDFSQYWYPITKIGPACQATKDAALSCHYHRSEGDMMATIGVAVTRQRSQCHLTLTNVDGQEIWRKEVNLSPGVPSVVKARIDSSVSVDDLHLRVSHQGIELVHYANSVVDSLSAVDVLATPIPDPADISSSDEMYYSALHLIQYRHPTRSARPYLEEALRRDNADSRAATLLATLDYQAGLYESAERLLRVAISRETRRNPNPRDGEAHYQIGLLLRRTGRPEEALEAFLKSTWNATWTVAGLAAAARIELELGLLDNALHHLHQALTRDQNHLQVRNLYTIACERTGNITKAKEVLTQSLSIDPLDWWARDIAGIELLTDQQTCLDVMLEYVSIGDFHAALRVSDQALLRSVIAGMNNATPLLHYYRARFFMVLGEERQAEAELKQARTVNATNCLLSRLDDVELIDNILSRDSTDARAHALRGHWLAHVGRLKEAHSSWLSALSHDSTDVVCLRNVAIYAYNEEHDANRAIGIYKEALSIHPNDAKLLYEADQMAQRLCVEPARRLQSLKDQPELVAQRDDLAVVCARLLIAEDNESLSIALLSSRQFGPWEGGEGAVLDAWEQAHYLASLKVLRDFTDPSEAISHLLVALDPPDNLGEARSAVFDGADLWLALGDAYCDNGNTEEAIRWWSRAGSLNCNEIRAEMIYYVALALRRLGDRGRSAEAITALTTIIASESRCLDTDYFATSVPGVPFQDNPEQDQTILRLTLQAQLASLHGDRQAALRWLQEVIDADPSQVRVIILLRNLPIIERDTSYHLNEHDSYRKPQVW